MTNQTLVSEFLAKINEMIAPLENYKISGSWTPFGENVELRLQPLLEPLGLEVGAFTAGASINIYFLNRVNYHNEPDNNPLFTLDKQFSADKRYSRGGHGSIHSLKFRALREVPDAPLSVYAEHVAIFAAENSIKNMQSVVNELSDELGKAQKSLDECKARRDTVVRRMQIL